MRKTLSFLAGLMAGSVTGGVLALLFAPHSGEELQGRIREYAEHLIEEGKSAAEAQRRELEGQLEAFKKGQPVTSPAE
jgi:gas vesicle protein